MVVVVPVATTRSGRPSLFMSATSTCETGAAVGTSITVAVEPIKSEDAKIVTPLSVARTMSCSPSPVASAAYRSCTAMSVLPP